MKKEMFAMPDIWALFALPVLSFVAGSVTVDGTSFPLYDPSVGFTIGTLNPSDSVTVIFQVEVN